MLKVDTAGLYVQLQTRPVKEAEASPGRESGVINIEIKTIH